MIFSSYSSGNHNCEYKISNKKNYLTHADAKVFPFVACCLCPVQADLPSVCARNQWYAR